MPLTEVYRRTEGVLSLWQALAFQLTRNVKAKQAICRLRIDCGQSHRLPRRAVVWLCIPTASFMVAHAMAVDDGLLAGWLLIARKDDGTKGATKFRGYELLGMAKAVQGPSRSRFAMAASATSVSAGFATSSTGDTVFRAARAVDQKIARPAHNARRKFMWTSEIFQ
jgi:hypothetical protein